MSPSTSISGRRSRSSSSEASLPRHDEIIENKLIDRDIWIEAGKHGFLGLEVPEKFGGGEANDFRFNAILTERLSTVSAALPSAFGIHCDIVAPYLVKLTTEDQQARWLPKFCTGEIAHGSGDVRAGCRIRPGEAFKRRPCATVRTG